MYASTGKHVPVNTPPPPPRRRIFFVGLMRVVYDSVSTALVALTLLALEDKQSSAPALEPTLRSRFYVYPHPHGDCVLWL